MAKERATIIYSKDFLETDKISSTHILNSEQLKELNNYI
jgi:hypothetical protein